MNIRNKKRRKGEGMGNRRGGKNLACLTKTWKKEAIKERNEENGITEFQKENKRQLEDSNSKGNQIRRRIGENNRSERIVRSL
jgi:hypothetical protein